MARLMVEGDEMSLFGQGQEPERQLLDYVQRLAGKGDGLMLLYVHLSRLPPFNRRDAQLRTIGGSFDLFVKAKQGTLFELVNRDLVFIFNEKALDEVKSVLAKHRRLIAGGPPLSGANDADDRLLSWFAMDRQYEEILTLLQEVVHSRHVKSLVEKPAMPAPGDSQGSRGLTETLTPGMLGRIESALAQADLTNVLRRQYACVLDTGKPLKHVFSELFVSIQNLQETLLPDVDLTSNRWLFHHMMAILDRRVLSAIAGSGPGSFTENFSVNLSIETLLSDAFVEFDTVGIAARRGVMLVEVQIADVLRDLEAFRFAREFIRAREYRLCLDGLTHPLLTLLDFSRFKVDMLKLLWSEDLAVAHHKTPHRLKEAVARAGVDRIVLCRCDTRRAIEVGLALGISIFQGRHVEDLIDAGRHRTRMTTGQRPR